MTLGILAPSHPSAQESPWGWWDDADSIARPLPDEDFLGTARGRARFSAASGTAGGPTDRRWDALATKDGWKVDVAGRCDSHCVGIRQRLSWSGERVQIKVGDLAARSDEVLLDGAGGVSNRTSPLSVLGSQGNSAGVDAGLDIPDLLPWEANVGSRLFSVPDGGTRGSLHGTVGALHAGVAFGDGKDNAPVPLAGAVLGGPAATMEAFHLGVPGKGVWRLALRSEGTSLRQEWALVHRDPPKDSRAAARDEATVRIAWRRNDTRVDWEGLARSDSNSRSVLRAVAGVSQDFAGLSWRLRSRWSGGDGSNSSSLTPGIRRNMGRFRPWAECAWSADDDPRPSAGLAWIDRAWRLEASSTRRTDGTWDWTSSSALSGGSNTLEVRVAQQRSGLAGGGTWIHGW